MALTDHDVDVLLKALAIYSLDTPEAATDCRNVAIRIGPCDPRVRARQAQQFEEYRRRSAERWNVQRLVGRRVRFTHLPDEEPRVIQSASRNGLVTVSGYPGREFPPDVFLLVED